jgi:predicted alpha/beta superfamily hydrolase
MAFQNSLLNLSDMRFSSQVRHLDFPKTGAQNKMQKSDSASKKWIALAALLICTGLHGCATGPHKPPIASGRAHTHHSNVPLDYLPSLKGGYFRLDSKAVQRPFHIYVRLPLGFDPKAETRYPVVYLLDGDSTFPMLAPTHLFLNYDERLPEAIVVGIAYGGFDRDTNKRDLDFSGPGKDARPGEGGAPQFLRFLREELIPEVERHYPVDPLKRVLVGQSNGGRFVLWSAMEDPDLFWGRIASNPSFTPARERLFESPSAHVRKDLNVVLSVGTRDTEIRMKYAREWATFWTARSDAPWDIRHLILEGGTHAASLAEVYRQSMTWLFREEIAKSPAKKVGH